MPCPLGEHIRFGNVNVITSGSISRRLFLVGTGGALLAACGSSDDGSASQDTSGADATEGDDTSTSDGDDFALIRYFTDPSITAGPIAASRSASPTSTAHSGPKAQTNYVPDSWTSKEN